MATWTNDQWRSTKHRVRVPPPERRSVERVSIPYFHHPNWSARHRVPPGLRGARRGAALRAGHRRRLPHAQGRGGVHMSLTVPVVDVSGPRAAVSEAIDEALHSVGFMAVTGHGVDPSLVAAMFDRVGAFFARPVEDKLLRRTGRSRRARVATRSSAPPPRRAPTTWPPRPTWWRRSTPGSTRPRHAVLPGGGASSSRRTSGPTRRPTCEPCGAGTSQPCRRSPTASSG